MAILIMPNLQLGSEHSLGLAWELSAFEFGVSEGATSVIFTGPLLAGGAPTDEADVVLKPALARFDDCLLVAEGDLGCKAPASWRAFSVQLWVYGALTPHWGGEAPQNQSWRGSVGLSSGFMAFGAVVAVPRRYKTKAKTLDRWLGLGFYRFGRPRRG